MAALPTFRRRGEGRERERERERGERGSMHPSVSSS